MERLFYLSRAENRSIKPAILQKKWRKKDWTLLSKIKGFLLLAYSYCTVLARLPHFAEGNLTHKKPVSAQYKNYLIVAPLLNIV